jgi:hypothetical protein
VGHWFESNPNLLKKYRNTTGFLISFMGFVLSGIIEHAAMAAIL